MNDERTRYLSFIQGKKKKILEYEEMLTFVSNRTAEAKFRSVDFETSRRAKNVGGTTGKGSNPVVVIKGDQYIEISERDFAEARNSFNPNHIQTTDVIVEKKIVNETPTTDMEGFEIGAKVTHKGFGQGIITSVDVGRLVVSFGSEEKHFILPDALIKGFISLSKDS